MALRRIKTYFQSLMLQETGEAKLLNAIAYSYSYMREHVLDCRTILKEFVAASHHRFSIFKI